MEAHLLQGFGQEADQAARCVPCRWQAATQALDALPALALTQPTEAAAAAARWLAQWQRLADAAARRGAATGAERAALGRLFRSHPQTAVALFGHLAARVLDVERLRGALVARLMFESARVQGAA